MKNKSSRVEYRIVDGYPRYRVGSDGSFWSKACKEWVEGYRGAKPGESNQWKRVLGSIDQQGYARVRVSNEGVSRIKMIHILVLEAFSGPRPEKMEACHNNGNQLDNRASNLRWGTASDNAKDRTLHGRSAIHERHWKAKLNWNQVDEIRRRNALGESQASLGRRFGVTYTAIGAIVRNERWVRTGKALAAACEAMKGGDAK